MADAADWQDVSLDELRKVSGGDDRSDELATVTPPNAFYASSPFQAAQKTEQLIQSRPSFIKQRLGLSPDFVQQHPFQTALTDIAAVTQGAESIPANIGLGIQQRRGVGQTFKDVVAGVKGERPAQLGDIARASGLKGISNPFVASLIGLGASAAPGVVMKIGQGVAGQLSRGLTAPARDIGNVATFAGRKGLLTELRGAVSESVENLEKQFGPQIDEIAAKETGKSVNLVEAATHLKDSLAEHSGLRNQILANPNKVAREFALKLADDPTQAANLSLQDAQLFKTGLSATPGLVRSQAGKAITTAPVRALSEVRNLIRREEVSVFPELESIFGDFRHQMDNFRLIRPSMAPARTGEQVFGGAGKLLRDVDMRLALKELLSHVTPRTGVFGPFDPFADVLGAARLAGTGKVVQRLAWPLAIGAGTYGGIRAVGRSLSGASAGSGSR